MNKIADLAYYFYIMQTVTFTTKFSVVIYCFFIFSFFLKHQKIQKHNIFMKMKPMI